MTTTKPRSKAQTEALARCWAAVRAKALARKLEARDLAQVKGPTREKKPRTAAQQAAIDRCHEAVRAKIAARRELKP